MDDIRGLEPKHYAIMGAFFTSLAVQVAGLKHGWGDALEPLFIAGVLTQVGVLFGALYAGAPGATGEKVDRRNIDRLPEVDVSKITPLSPEGRSKLPMWLLPVALAGALTVGGAFSLPACHAPVTITTPAGQSAYKADQVIQRLQEVSNVVMADTGTQPGQIKPKDAFTIIEWISGDDQHVDAKTGKVSPTLGVAQLVASTSGQGWKVAAKAGWVARVRAIFDSYPKLSPYTAIVDALLEVM